MIVVTGGLGFIGQNLVNKLKRTTNDDIVVLDIVINDINTIEKWLFNNANKIKGIYHLGAITDTTLSDEKLFNTYNYNASKFIWNLCAEFDIPLVYASSAATYGDGSAGFDDEKPIDNLVPLNLYGWSKQKFDIWAIGNKIKPKHWYGLKFFNVYGYGESHKGRMASVVYQAYNQIKNTGTVSLFKSYNNDYGDGMQLRDFIFVEDVVDVCMFFMNKLPDSGIYNVGTGKSRSFNDLVKIIFNYLDLPKNITYIDMPIEIRNSYQYYTEAKINKLRNVGFLNNFYELEEGVIKYLNNLIYENR